MLYSVSVKGQRGYSEAVSWGLQNIYSSGRCPVCKKPSLYPGLIDDVHILDGSKWPDIICGLPLIVSEKVNNAWNSAGLRGFTAKRIKAIPVIKGKEILIKSYSGETASLPGRCRIMGGPMDCYSISIPAIATVDPEKTVVTVTHIRNGEYSHESPPMLLKDVDGICVRCGQIEASESTVAARSISLQDESHHDFDFYCWKTSIFVSARVIEVCLKQMVTNLRWVRSDDAMNADAPCLEELP
jgi:hypothetical protein